MSKSQTFNPFTQQDSHTEIIASQLFGQIIAARDEAKRGGIIDEQLFNDRLNHMFTAGYLLGYVDTCLESICNNDIERKKDAQAIFEKLFPGSGNGFIKSKLIARQQAASLPETNDNYQEIVNECRAFDTGMSLSEEEVLKYLANQAKAPNRLKEFLLIGEI